MSSPHAWVTHAIGEYLVLVWLTAALAALFAALVLPWAERMRRRLSVGLRLPGDSRARADGAGA